MDKPRIDGMNQDDHHSQGALAAAWSVCVGPVLRVMDPQDGSDCLTRVRHLAGGMWITSDPDMGYTLISRSVLEGYARMGFALIGEPGAVSFETSRFSQN